MKKYTKEYDFEMIKPFNTWVVSKLFDCLIYFHNKIKC